MSSLIHKSTFIESHPTKCIINLQSNGDEIQQMFHKMLIYEVSIYNRKLQFNNYRYIHLPK